MRPMVSKVDNKAEVTTATCSKISMPWRPLRVAAVLSRMEGADCSRASVPFAHGMRWGLV